LMDQYSMLENIRLHSFVVARVAETIVTNLQPPPGKDIKPPDMELVRAGALLHDIAKTMCLDGSCRHPEEGQLICEENGYHEVAHIVREHVILNSFFADDYKRGQFSAREIVYYADKRVNHDKIVTLNDRLDYIVGRYSDGSNYIEHRIRSNFNVCFDLENYLFSFIHFHPDDLQVKLIADPF